MTTAGFQQAGLNLAAGWVPLPQFVRRSIAMSHAANWG